MSGYGPEQISAIRMMAAEIEFRAKSDSIYLQRLRDDPEKVLTEAGFDEMTRAEYRAQLDASAGPCPADVCDPLSCLITSCCWYTTVEPPDTTVAVTE